MTKGKIIIISIISFIILLNTILFGFVFRLRKQEVCIVEGSNINTEEIIVSAGLKNGKSIFMLDKQTAINNIEKENAYIKVVQIKTVGVTKIQFIVRKRYPLYYYKQGDNYYILDEDLKILNTTTTKPEEYILLNEEISSNYLTVGHFIGSVQQHNAAYNLFVAMFGVVETNGEQARKDICSKIESFKLAENNRTIIKTSSGATLDIENYNNNLTDKINKCFTAITSKEPTELEGSTFKIMYDLQGNEYFRFFSAEIGE